jgi:hypothetical protein
LSHSKLELLDDAVFVVQTGVVVKVGLEFMGVWQGVATDFLKSIAS